MNLVRATLSLCEFASEAMSTLGCRCLTYPQVSSGLPFLPNKPRVSGPTSTSQSADDDGGLQGTGWGEGRPVYLET